MTDTLLVLAAELEQRGEPFALAMVVRSEPPTSAKPGAKALVREDGRVSGWIGGACAEPVVVREALRALGDGRPRLVRLVGEGRPSPGRTEGILEYAMTCHSGGTLEIYVEPHLPKRLLVLIGHGPVVEAMATLGRDADYSIVVLGHDVAPSALEGLGLTHRASVVVATHADSDADALDAVLRTEAGYVSLVASRRRAAVILERLARRGVVPERLACLKAPAGLDIGAETPAEIAISILAELIQHHRGEKSTGESEADPARAAAAEARDPVCGMLVQVATARYRSEVSGQLVHFCCRSCQETFDADPARYRATLER
jgi:xanthine dehydrogenase accessory factor